MARGDSHIDSGPRADHHIGLMQAHYPVRDTGRGEKRRRCHGGPPGKDHPAAQEPLHHHHPVAPLQRQGPMSMNPRRPACAVHRDRGPMLSVSLRRGPGGDPATRASTDRPGPRGCSPGSARWPGASRWVRGRRCGQYIKPRLTSQPVRCSGLPPVSRASAQTHPVPGTVRRSARVVGTGA